MYETLLEYVKEREAANGWDGNVPANYKVNDKSLGRWVNRQRSSYTKKELKQEQIDKLNAIGLKWSVHERKTVLPDTATSATLSSTSAKAKSDGLNGK